MGILYEPIWEYINLLVLACLILHFFVCWWTISQLRSGLSQTPNWLGREPKRIAAWFSSAYQYGFAQKWGILHNSSLYDGENIRGKTQSTYWISWKTNIHIIGQTSHDMDKQASVAANPVPRSEVKAVKARIMRHSCTCCSINKWSEYVRIPQCFYVVLSKKIEEYSIAVLVGLCVFFYLFMECAIQHV